MAETSAEPTESENRVRSVESVGSTAKLMNRALRWSNMRRKGASNGLEAQVAAWDAENDDGAVGLTNGGGFMRDDEWDVLESASNHIGSGNDAESWYRFSSRRSVARLAGDAGEGATTRIANRRSPADQPRNFAHRRLSLVLRDKMESFSSKWRTLFRLWVRWSDSYYQAMSREDLGCGLEEVISAGVGLSSRSGRHFSSRVRTSLAPG